jgi:putative Ca2+/H+ antiporter (TMEM165/GDT1 family)
MAHGAFSSIGETNGSILPRRREVATVAVTARLEAVMEAFLISLSTVAIAELGDRTQLLSLVLATRYRRPWRIAAGVLLATLANHALAGFIGVWFAGYLSPRLLDGLVGASMIVMALWMLKPDKLDEDDNVVSGRGAFLATLVAFFIAEMGDKTQIATIALAAGYSNLAAVVAGTTIGMMIANVPVIFAGHAFAKKLPLRAIHYGSCALFLVLGAIFLVRAFQP